MSIPNNTALAVAWLMLFKAIFFNFLVHNCEVGSRQTITNVPLPKKKVVMLCLGFILSFWQLFRCPSFSPLSGKKREPPSACTFCTVYFH